MGKLKRHYEEVVAPTWNYAGKIHDRDGHWSNAALGLAGEAGEVADIIKKMLYHAPKDRREELKLELGDVFYYLNQIMALSGLSLQEILEANKDKLFARHKDRVNGR